jgi:3-hydroxybutyryl-CoA dehydrogenase
VVRSKKFGTLWRVMEKRETVIGRIQFTTDYYSLKECETVIENVSEKWDIKKEVYNKINLICDKRRVFGVNTSAISITKIASQTDRPDKDVGVHFMNPVPLKPMVEVVRGHHTSEETIDYIKILMAGINKECIVVGDSPGFITNRTMMIFINEAIFSLYENVATANEIDTLFKTCFGHKMGPLQTADLIGLDTILYSLEVLYESFNDSKYRPCILLKKMVDAGLYGMKNGKGFYTYGE